MAYTLKLAHQGGTFSHYLLAVVIPHKPIRSHSQPVKYTSLVSALIVVTRGTDNFSLRGQKLNLSGGHRLCNKLGILIGCMSEPIIKRFFPRETFDRSYTTLNPI